MLLATQGETMSLPLVRLKEIPLEGMEISCQVEASDLELEPTDAILVGPFDVKASLLAIDPDYHVQGELSGIIRRNCVRCLEDFQDSVQYPFSVTYREKESTTGNRLSKTKGKETVVEKEELDESEMDDFWYEGETLDLGPMLREFIILGNPIQALCQEDCRGLCPTCGGNRNITPCACLEARLPNPFAVLQQLRNGQQGANQKITKVPNPTGQEPTQD